MSSWGRALACASLLNPRCGTAAVGGSGVAQAVAAAAAAVLLVMMAAAPVAAAAGAVVAMAATAVATRWQGSQAAVGQ